MRRALHALLTAALLAAALACYAAGLDRNLVGMVLCGAAFEAAFWIRLFRRAPHPPAATALAGGRGAAGFGQNRP